MDDKGIRTMEINLKLEGCLIVLCFVCSFLASTQVETLSQDQKVGK